jgi:hypothetical protein
MAPSIEGLAAYLRRPVSELKGLIESEFDEVRAAMEGLMYNFTEQVEHYFPTDGNFEKIIQAGANDVPATRVMPIEEIIIRAEELVENVLQSWIFLVICVVAHEETIRKRWLKKTRAQRRDVLLKAWPNMSSTHRQDFEALLLTKHHNILELSEIPDALTWPYINQEDLLRPKALLIFLNACGRYHPYTFAHSDLELAPMFKLRKELLDLRKEKTYTMNFIERKETGDYGEVINWETESEAMKDINQGLSVNPDHGLQILHIQSGILAFLGRCCVEILPDMRSQGDIPMPKPEPPLLSENADSHRTLDIITREAPYKIPAKLDYVRLCALVIGRKTQAEDHVWALREDPSYFSDWAQNYRQHRAELILDVNGKPHPSSTDHTLFSRALKLMLDDAHICVFLWDKIARRITELHAMSQKYANIIGVGKELPKDYFELMVETRFLLEAMSLDLIDLVKAGFPTSPPLREFFVRNDDKFYQKSDLGVVENSKALNRLFSLLGCFSNKDMRDFLTLHVLMDELERFIQDDPEGKSYISSWVIFHVSQLSVISECLHQFHLYQPWAKHVESAIEKRKMTLLDGYSKMLRPFTPIILLKFYHTRLATLGNPHDGKFDYPIHKRRNKTNVNIMRAAEDALDTFWKAADAHWKARIRRTPHMLIKDILGDRTLQRTPPWVEPTRSRTSPQVDYIYLPFSSAYHDIDKSITGNFNKLSLVSKTKEKTRGVPINNNNFTLGLVQATAGDIVDPPSTTFTVDKRAHKVFNTLFHSPNSPNQPGAIPWPDFLHVMVSVGFNAEKLQGSSWHFTPSNLDVERSIQFHEPHPGNKLPFTWARRYGRRLARAYGWNSNMFTLA